MDSHRFRLRLGYAVLCAAFGAIQPLDAQQRDRAALIAAIDSIVMEPVDSGKVAGISVAVVRGADTLRIKGYGYADLEFEVPTPDDAVYEIGSVTKQFTAAAVLQLQEQGLLSLDDELTKYLPDYPTQGHRITIRRLLDHTSGIKGYTEMPVFWRTMVSRRLPRDSLVALFAAEPFDFAPGEAMIYNNSAYFLLGLVIEKASGQPYEEYIAEHLFKPAGMTRSLYCSKRALIKHRAKGYQFGNQGPTNAPFLDHTWPYAAGSICSTAGDLVAWVRAVHGHGDGGDLLSEDAYRQLITPDTLNDGTRLRYAKGLTVAEIRGRRQIAHGGGIFGYVTDLRYYPDDDLIIAVLINGGSVSPASIAAAIEQLILREWEEPAGRSFAGDLEQFTGTYKGPGRGREFTATVALDSAGLTLKVGNRDAQDLSYVDGLTFSAGTSLYTFVREGREITGLRADQIGGYYILRKTGS
ncbi:MAG: serine hydrolase [Gemmatimonadales bacterium]|nr:serine hydrolase [Gemmatimonadales bacterium]NIN11929.1 serine hydrolase [Gemmatimonadales bacterium]NIN50483.1 serine hydrolase [Gemmatimonadales bacterium]NIP07947.1 serine hydrolase [Gemmatimonadales bacterium]NIR01965.1 serine hydrolase [Gemmatimonadales bacterium]